MVSIVSMRELIHSRNTCSYLIRIQRKTVTQQFPEHAFKGSCWPTHPKLWLNKLLLFFNEKAVICCFVHWKIFPYPSYVSKRPSRLITCRVAFTYFIWIFGRTTATVTPNRRNLNSQCKGIAVWNQFLFLKIRETIVHKADC